MEVTIGHFAKLVNTTIRTLRYYDKIELLKPTNRNEKGQKVYTRKEWELYQKISIFKQLGLSLEEIKTHLYKDTLKTKELLDLQEQMIKQKMEELNESLQTIQRMKELYGKHSFSDKELEEFTFILLDVFRREKKQIHALEKHFQDNPSILAEIESLKDPQFNLERDKATLELLSITRKLLVHNETVNNPEMLNAINNLVTPTTRTLFNLLQDETFLESHQHEFNSYIPEDLAMYLYEGLKAYFTSRSSQEEKKYQ
jgi:DNA-binding transcriptional MerR regulator